MKTKNVKVKLKDLKQGKIFYTAHPVYGIDTWVCQGKPKIYNHKVTNYKSLFVPASSIYDGKICPVEEFGQSAEDTGITSTYNDRRTFRKKKQAEAWMKKWEKDKGFQERHARHEALIEDDFYCSKDDLYCSEDDFYYNEDGFYRSEDDLGWPDSFFI